jgi:DNA-directed RNA polymerase subunit beta
MLTIKSDDVVGRAKAFEAIVKGTDIPTPKVPESFKVLIKELQSLGLNVLPIGAVVTEEAQEAKDEQATEAAKPEIMALQETLEAKDVPDESVKPEAATEAETAELVTEQEVAADNA